MTKKERSEWRNWWYFFGRRVREFMFLSLWVAMAWALDVYVVSSCPVNGPPKYMLLVFEGLFDMSTLIELIRLLFWPYQAKTSRWLRERSNSSNH